MKKILAILLCLALLFSLFGCDEPSSGVSGQFYYRRNTTEFGTTDGIIASEPREIPDPAAHTDLLLDLYFAGPQDSDLTAPFPRGSSVSAWEIRNETLYLTMNSSFGALSGVELTIACTCICKTMTGLLPVSQVSFQLKDGLLGGESALLFSVAQIHLYDNSLDQSRAEFTVYYADNTRRYLIAEEVSVSLATEDDVIAFLMDALLTPPDNSGLYSALPRKTRLLSYSVDGGICTIDLSSEFEQNSWTGCEAQRLSFLCVVNTLTQLEQIQQVEFSVDGNLLVSYQSLSISEPFVFDENAIGPVRTGMNEFDVTLYLSNGSENCLAAVPTRLRQTSGISQAELVVQALLDYQNANSLFTSIPEGTTVQSVTLRNGTCLVDLSAEFLSSEEHLIRSVRSIISSVCSLDGINSAQITVDGQTPEGSYADLFGVLSPQSSWFL